MDGRVVVELAGEWDIARKDELHALLEAIYDQDDVVIDLTACEYIDSTVLSELVRMRRARDDNGFAPAYIVVQNPRLLKVLSITELDTIFRIVSSFASVK